MSTKTIRTIWPVLLLTAALSLSLVGGAGAQDDRFSANLKSMSVQEVLKLISEQGGINMVLHNDVKGNLTVFLNDVTVSEALEAVCRVGELAWTVTGDIYYIMPLAAYEKTYGEKFRSDQVTRVFMLKHADPAAMSGSLQQFKSQEGKLIVDQSRNAVICADRPETIRAMADVVATLDQPPAVRTVSVENASAKQLMELIQPSLRNRNALRVDAGTNRLVVEGSEAEVDRICAMIEQFDHASLTETRMFVVGHGDPVTIRDAVEPMLTPEIGRVHADEKTSRIFVTDFPGALADIAGVIASLDERQPEVLIEAKIVQVILSDQYKLGVNWQAVSDKINGGYDVTVRTLGETAAADMLGIQGRSSGVDGSFSYNAFVEALEVVGTTNLLSSPRIMTTNNTEARIHVGKSQPYVTTDSREEEGVVRNYQKVTNVDVGVQLSVTPRIHDDEYISIVVHPEVSSVTDLVTESQIPVVETSETTTTVTVKNGVTAIIAGLIEEEEIITKTRVPILGSIPLLGKLFSSESKRMVKKELVVLLTPRIVWGDENYDVEGIGGS